MKHMLLAVLLLTATPAWAAWKLLGHSDGDGGFDIYGDPVSLVRSGDTAKMWGLVDYKTPQKSAFGKQYSSIQRQSEYDCKEARSRILDFTQYSEPKGGGAVVFSSGTPSRWERILPGTIAEAEAKIACGKP